MKRFHARFLCRSNYIILQVIHGLSFGLMRRGGKGIFVTRDPIFLFSVICETIKLIFEIRDWAIARESWICIHIYCESWNRRIVCVIVSSICLKKIDLRHFGAHAKATSASKDSKHKRHLLSKLCIIYYCNALVFKVEKEKKGVFQ